MRPTPDIAKDIHSLTEFKRNTSEMLDQMKSSGRPLILTVNGKAELVVQDAESYQQTLELLEQVDAIEGIRRGLDHMKRGKARTAALFVKRTRRKYGIPR
jgi:prevent-host-death family protein